MMGVSWWAYRAELRRNGELVASVMATHMKEIRKTIAEEWLPNLEADMVIRVRRKRI